MEKFSVWLERRQLLDNWFLQENLNYEVGTKVRIIRTNGDIENNWTVIGHQTDSSGPQAIVKSPDGTLKRAVLITELNKWQDLKEIQPKEMSLIKKSQQEVLNLCMGKSLDQNLQLIIRENRTLKDAYRNITSTMTDVFEQTFNYLRGKSIENYIGIIWDNCMASLLKNIYEKNINTISNKEDFTESFWKAARERREYIVNMWAKSKR